MRNFSKSGIKNQQVRGKIGLTVSFDMGWNKRSSGHRYDSLSIHAFIIGVYTRRIIGCVVFCKSRATCNARNKRNEHVDENIVTEVTNHMIEQMIQYTNENDNEHVSADATVSPNSSSPYIAATGPKWQHH